MIAVENLTVPAGGFALHNISLTVPTGSYGILMGKTGSGKTTLLEAVAGLRQVAGGRILLGGREVTRAPAARRGIGYVPQDGALFAGMTVGEQLSFALRIRHLGRRQIRDRVAELADQLGLQDLLQRSPRNLSGGEKQRVALGRALSFRPQYLLLDEPLSAVDDKTRDQLRGMLRQLPATNQVTVLHVTHSQADTDELADVCFDFHDGSAHRRDLS